MPCPRIERERLEHEIIGPYGVLAENSRGRLFPEEACEIRTCFQRDVDRITHSKSFRRLKHKTQVFLQPEGDHYRTRLTHTLEVTRLARTVARALRLNEDLAEAIGLGHDLGHTPFGHAGERALNTIYEGGFVPWFGTQLVNGNSLIGARRQVYSESALTATSKGLHWYENAPERVPLGTERKKRRGNAQIYHFLLGDPGMCSYSD